MIVCVCNALCERQCREVAARPETRGAGCIYRQLGCRVRCGACLTTMREIVDHVRAEHGHQATAPALSAEE
jgi:bacterioferritin-associated ferredoxin